MAQEHLDTSTEMSLLKGGDIFLVLTAVVGSILFFVVQPPHEVEGFVVMHNNTPLCTLSLQDTLCTVQGSEGEMVLEVSHEKVSVRKSSCTQQICVHQGALGSEGALVCVPNKVVVMPLLRRKNTSVKVDAYVR